MNPKSPYTNPVIRPAAPAAPAARSRVGRYLLLVLGLVSIGTSTIAWQKYQRVQGLLAENARLEKQLRASQAIVLDRSRGQPAQRQVDPAAVADGSVEVVDIPPPVAYQAGNLYAGNGRPGRNGRNGGPGAAANGANGRRGPHRAWWRWWWWRWRWSCNRRRLIGQRLPISLPSLSTLSLIFGSAPDSTSDLTRGSLPHLLAYPPC